MGIVKNCHCRTMKHLFRFLAFASFMTLANCITDDFLYAMAQSSCVGLDSTGEVGYMYAVKRTQNGPLDCNEICADGSLLMQDGELVNGHYHLGKCINGLQVNSVTSEFPKDVMKLGPKIYNYQTCTNQWINYCCCKFQHP